MIRVLFMGTPAYAKVILEALWLSEEIEVVGVVSQPDKPVGRKQELTPPPVKESCLRLAPHTPLFQPENLKEERWAKEWRALEPDFIVVAAYGKILPKVILDIAPCINLHASILPLYRGASPIHESLRRGDAWSGVSAMRMEEGLDCGEVLGCSFVEIKEEWDVSRLFEELANRAAALTLKVLKRFSEIRPLPQVGADSSYCRKIRKEEGLVGFVNAKELYDQFRAYKVWPGIFLRSELKLKEITLLSETGEYRMGEILAINKEGIVVGCKEGSLRILMVQAPSKKEVDAVSYVNGKRLGVGDILF